jgi:hypothetical protein
MNKNCHDVRCAKYLPLKVRQRPFSELRRIRFADDGNLSVTPADGAAYLDSFDVQIEIAAGQKVNLTATISGWIYTEDSSATGSPVKPYFVPTDIPLDEVREILITGTPVDAKPLVKTFAWTQSVRGSVKHGSLATSTTPRPENYLIGGMPFSGELHGGGLLPDSQVLFCKMGDYKCEHPVRTLAVEVRSPELLTFKDAILPAASNDFWMICVRTADGYTSVSERLFGVERAANK